MQHVGRRLSDRRKDAALLRFTQPCGDDDEVELLGTQKNFNFGRSGCLRFISSGSEDGAATLQDFWVISGAENANRITGHKNAPVVIEDLMRSDPHPSINRR